VLSASGFDGRFSILGFVLITCGVYFTAMSTMTEVKKATEQLSAKDRWELFVWLRESEDVRGLQCEELRRDIAIGVEQADRGEIAPLDIASIRARIHQRLEGSTRS
jgi:hypothetical protein